MTQTYGLCIYKMLPICLCPAQKKFWNDKADSSIETKLESLKLWKVEDNGLYIDHAYK